jgi:hypothetical protein
MKVAARMEQIPFSGIRTIFEEVIRREKAGEKLIHLNIGRPDFDTPAHIKEGPPRRRWMTARSIILPITVLPNSGMLSPRNSGRKTTFPMIPIRRSS